MKPADLEGSTTPRTDGLIDKVMAQYPVTEAMSDRSVKASMVKYFEAVHQELAPLCRELEAENIALRERLCHPKLKQSPKP